MAYGRIAVSSNDQTGTSVEVIDDDALVDFTGTPAVSQEVGIEKTSTLALYVTPTPESGQKIRLRLEFSDGHERTDWYSEDNQDPAAPHPQLHDFSASNPVVIVVEKLASRVMRLQYGYVGGDGTGAVLRVKVQGRA